MNNKEINKIMPGLLEQFGIKDKAMQTKLMNPMFDASSKALMGLTTSAVGGMFNAMNTPAQQMGNFGQNYNPIMANGGMMGQVQAEVEGGEVMQTPDGQMEKVQGPRHEQGGVPVEAPEGTMVFSDRIKLEGKTMAQRKELREKKLMKLKKLVDKNPSDKILKNSYERVIEKNAVQEMADIAHQEQVDTHEKSMQAFSNVAQMMMNGGMMTNKQYGNGGQMKKYANGGTMTNDLPKYAEGGMLEQPFLADQFDAPTDGPGNPPKKKVNVQEQLDKIGNLTKKYTEKFEKDIKKFAKDKIYPNKMSIDGKWYYKAPADSGWHVKYVPKSAGQQKLFFHKKGTYGASDGNTFLVHSPADKHPLVFTNGGNFKVKLDDMTRDNWGKFEGSGNIIIEDFELKENEVLDTESLGGLGDYSRMNFEEKYQEKYGTDIYGDKYDKKKYETFQDYYEARNKGEVVKPLTPEKETTKEKTPTKPVKSEKKPEVKEDVVEPEVKEDIAEPETNEDTVSEKETLP